ncbi:TonB family protein [Paraburkholderia silviterrae]|uniref:TonB family protein n=1 Tax=Paraburkholderia silviterrae TaxID=2528715 RepID=A0A4R5M8C1_9BURK|nr:energy transducer TonB [Paraburkholderia silviterrae]TDG22730.1 TonB family protein [Paraburkholderia silviterrae]
MNPTSSLQLRPPRERGTGRAFGLAVSMHVVLLALLLAGTRGPQTASTSSHTVVTGPVTPLLLAGPAPRAASRTWASQVTAAPARLIAANDPTAVMRHGSNLVKPQRLHRLDSRTVRTGVEPRARLTEEPSVVQRGNRPVDPRRAARLAALQGAAGRPLLESGVAASAGYAEKVARRVRANVIAPFDIEGDPSAVIAVTCTPSGALLSVTVQRASGNPQWDRAVVAAVENSDPMPADVNGSTPTSFVMTFRPKG